MNVRGAAPLPAFRPPKITPVPRPISTLGLLRAMVSDPASAVPPAAYEAGCVRTREGGDRLVFVTDPDLVETVLLREQEAFPKSHVDHRLFEPLLGHSLLTLEGADWQWQRRLAAPAFRHGELTAYLPAMGAPFEDLARTWSRSPGRQRIDEAMTAAAIDVVCRAFFSGLGQLDASRVAEAIGRYLGPVSWTIALGTLGLPGFLPHPGRLRMWRAARDARRRVRTFVARRRRMRQDPPDLGQVLMDARDQETARSLGDEELIDLFLTLIAAGHETSANALTWTLYCLAAQPDRQEALAGQVRAVVGDGSVDATHLEGLEDLRQFLDESMRLFPPVPIMARRALRDGQLGTERVAAGTLVFIPIYAIHRHRALWAHPDLFDPDRFHASSARTRPRCAYMPFGAGPRICIGASFARLEMLVGLATLLGRIKFRLATTEPPQPFQRITLRPRGGLVLQVDGRP